MIGLGAERLKRGIRDVVARWQLPRDVRREARRDAMGLPAGDPGIDAVVDAGIAWLATAQDRSASNDGGVARHYSPLSGWAPSYPETTGYIVPTMLSYAALRPDSPARSRAQRMLDWLVSIQLEDGAFQAGIITTRPRVACSFNTGQILLGLARGTAELGDAYRGAMVRAAEWMVAAQDPDGCWRRFPSPMVVPGEKSYDTHAAWGLLEAARVAPGARYDEAAMANLRWALTRQRPNGWMENCCLTQASEPLTHTLGYALRGLLEGYRYCGEAQLLAAARRTADGLLCALGPDGFLPGRLDAQWRGTVPWACLTGSVQVSQCWLMLYEELGERRYLEAAAAVNRYVRRTVRLDAPEETRGAVKGSFPFDGSYGRYQYPNWAVKFCVDSQLLERTIRGEEAGRRSPR